MPENHKKAFSLIELLITCCLLAVVIGIIVVSYSNLRARAVNIAQDRDQKLLKEISEAFRVTGGGFVNIGSLRNITTSTTLSREQMAAALTLLFQKPVNVSVNARVRNGAVATLLPDDKVVVPYANADGLLRLVVDGTTGALKLQTVGDGFIVVNRNSELGATAQIASVQAQLALMRARGSNTEGTTYADNTSYVWDDDQNTIEGPTTTSMPPTVPPSIPTFVKLAIDIDFIDGTGISTGNKFNFKQYDGSRAVVTVTRTDNVALDITDFTVTSFRFGAQTFSILDTSKVSGTKSGNSYVFTITLPNVLPANEWPADTQSLDISLEPVEGKNIEERTYSAQETVQTEKSPLTLQTKLGKNIGGVVDVDTTVVMENNFRKADDATVIFMAKIPDGAKSSDDIAEITDPTATAGGTDESGRFTSSEGVKISTGNANDYKDYTFSTASPTDITLAYSKSLSLN